MRLPGESSRAEQSWGSASILNFGGLLALDPFPPVHTITAFLWEVTLPFPATSQFLQILQHPRFSSLLLPRPWFSGLLLLGSRTPAEEEKARAGLGDGLQQGHRQGAPTGWPHGRSCCKALLIPSSLCTSPGSCSGLLVLSIQIGESQVCLQPRCEIPSGNQPSIQQGQRVPFGLI